jgi:small subunit ribosomal protein S12
MSTSQQLIRRIFVKKKAHKRTPALLNCPQSRGTVRRARIVTPRKPNSARRPVAKVLLRSKERVTAHIPGVGHNLKSHSQVLIRGGGARDLPGVRYTCIRGVYDLSGVIGKKWRRSIYGIKQPNDFKKKPRRKFRSV